MTALEKRIFFVFMCIMGVNAILLLVLGFKIAVYKPSFEKVVCPEVHVALNGVPFEGDDEAEQND